MNNPQPNIVQQNKSDRGGLSCEKPDQFFLGFYVYILLTIPLTDDGFPRIKWSRLHGFGLS